MAVGEAEADYPEIDLRARAGQRSTESGRKHEVPLVGTALVADSDVISSPEVVGDGLTSFRHLLFRRPLGETLVAASPQNWNLVEVEIS